VLLAALIHQRTTVSLAWIADALQMRSAANVSQQIHRLAGWTSDPVAKK
jgi:hypothetical protein